MTTSTEATDQLATYESAWTAAMSQTVHTLTAVVRLRHPTAGQPDVAGFLAQALAHVTANTGGIEEVVAGRPGSWEADLVAQLIAGTIGEDPDPTEVARWRTAPVVVRLNVAEYVEDRLGRPGLDDALALIGQYYDALPDDAWESAGDIQQRDLDATVERYTTAYGEFATSFEGAVREAAATVLLAGEVPVTVQVDADPWSPWWSASSETGAVTRSTTCDEGDHLAFDLWATAINEVTMPEITVVFSTQPNANAS